jgi:hypothetical protein
LPDLQVVVVEIIVKALVLVTEALQTLSLVHFTSFDPSLEDSQASELGADSSLMVWHEIGEVIEVACSRTDTKVILSFGG